MTYKILNASKLTFISSIVALSGAASAQHADVRPYVAASQIVTGAHDDATGQDIAVVRAYGYDFGEDAADPYFIGDPGFNAEAGSGLTPGSQLRFNVLGDLVYWNGTTPSPSFGATPADESIRFNFGASNAFVTDTSGSQPGFTLQTVQSNGSVHRHLNTFLNGADGNAVAGDGVEPAAGIYAVKLELTSSDPLLAASDPFYLVFNNGLDESPHEQSIEFLAASLVPEPSSMTLLAAGSSLLRRRRR